MKYHRPWRSDMAILRLLALLAAWFIVTLLSATTSANPYLTTEDLAERWHTTSKGVLQLRHRGDGPRGRRIGRRVLFHIDDVEASEASRADDPKPA
jgi:hypothetical protein